MIETLHFICICISSALLLFVAWCGAYPVWKYLNEPCNEEESKAWSDYCLTVYWPPELHTCGSGIDHRGEHRPSETVGGESDIGFLPIPGIHGAASDIQRSLPVLTDARPSASDESSRDVEIQREAIRLMRMIVLKVDGMADEAFNAVKGMEHGEKRDLAVQHSRTLNDVVAFLNREIESIKNPGSAALWP